MRFGRAAIVVATLLPGCVHHRVEETATDRFRFDVSERPRVEVGLERSSIEILKLDSYQTHFGRGWEAGPHQD